MACFERSAIDSVLKSFFLRSSLGYSCRRLLFVDGLLNSRIQRPEILGSAVQIHLGYVL